MTPWCKCGELPQESISPPLASILTGYVPWRGLWMGSISLLQVMRPYGYGASCELTSSASSEPLSPIRSLIAACYLGRILPGIGNLRLHRVGWQTDAARIHDQLSLRKKDRSRQMAMPAENDRLSNSGHAGFDLMSASQ